MSSTTRNVLIGLFHSCALILAGCGAAEKQIDVEGERGTYGFACAGCCKRWHCCATDR